jgi:hypothetical protein
MLVKRYAIIFTLNNHLGETGAIAITLRIKLKKKKKQQDFKKRPKHAKM